MTGPLIPPDAELNVRRGLWINHGCSPAALYGDDGQMQCGACLLDFKADPLLHLMLRLFALGRLHAGRLPEVATPGAVPARPLEDEAVAQVIQQMRDGVFQSRQRGGGNAIWSDAVEHWADVLEAAYETRSPDGDGLPMEKGLGEGRGPRVLSTETHGVVTATGRRTGASGAVGGCDIHQKPAAGSEPAESHTLDLASLQALSAQWRRQADLWHRGIGDNQNTRLYREVADQLDAWIAAHQPTEGE